MFEAADGGVEILTDALAGEQLFGQQVEGFGIVGVGCLDDPRNSLFGVGGAADAVEPHAAGFGLGGHHAFGGHALIPMQGFGFVHAAEAAGFIQTC